MTNYNPITYLLSLKNATAENICGGKASHLAHALKLDIPVPMGFVITDVAFQNFLHKNHLTDKINDLMSLLDLKNITQLQLIEKTIKKTLIEAPLMPELKNELKAIWVKYFKDKTLIIRSSGVGEDSKHASFAGQLDSFLNITSFDELELTVKKCWASYWSARVISYQHIADMQLKGMGVIIQEQVDAKFAGVLFTQAPVNQFNDNNDEMLGEYCIGQGSALVSGEITPGQFRISRKELSCNILSEPKQSLPSNSKLNPDLLSQLASDALILEQYFGSEQDVEWAISDADQLFIVQSRPIVTAIKKSKPGITWSNANVRENFPDPITPFLYSIASRGYSYYFRNLAQSIGVSSRRINAMKYPLNNIIGVHGARMYYNLSSIHDVIRMAPFGDRLVQFFNNFVGAKEQPQCQPSTVHFKDPTRHRVRQFIEFICITLKTAKLFLFIDRGVRKFESDINRYAANSHPVALQSMNIIELRNCMREFIDIRCHKWNNAAIADVAAMVSYGVLQQLLQRAFPDKQQGSIVNSLLKGCTGLVSSEPVHELWKLSRHINEEPALLQLFNTNPSKTILEELKNNQQQTSYKEFYVKLNVFIEEYGFRCSGELMLTIPSFQEKPATLLDIIKNYILISHESPEQVLQLQKNKREQYTKQILNDLSNNRCSNSSRWPGYALLVKLILAWTHKSISYRERARFKQALLYSRLRRIILSMGEILTKQNIIIHPQDILFLSYEEIDDLISSQSMFPYQTQQTINLRLQEHKTLGAMVIPDRFIMDEGEYWDVNKINPVNKIPVQDGATQQLSGMIACGGKITSRATILNSVSESDKLQANDILITTQTDPGWSHIFFLIKGLVIERGGMLSHGAILAREFGIPAVVGIHNVTQLIPQHSTVFVDADIGVVQIVD